MVVLQAWVRWVRTSVRKRGELLTKECAGALRAKRVKYLEARETTGASKARLRSAGGITGVYELNRSCNWAAVKAPWQWPLAA